MNTGELSDVYSLDASEKKEKKIKIIWSLLRIAMGWIFLWSFLDKTFGFGFATKTSSAWLNGGSPTYNYLTFATKGPFSEIYQSLSGIPMVDWLFMLGILFVGLTLVFGFAVKFGAIIGLLFNILFYTSGFIPPEHNPFLDEHIVNSIIMIGLIIVVPSHELGIGRLWEKISLVNKHSLLK